MYSFILDTIDPSEFVRHLLIESTPKGVHLKDCKDEPLFGKCLCFRKTKYKLQTIFDVPVSIISHAIYYLGTV